MSTGNKENYKRITKNTAMLYIRMLFSMIVSLYTSRVVLNTLGVQDYGVYNVVGGVVVMFGFLNNAMAASTQRFLTFELDRGDFEKLKRIFGVSITLHAIICFIIFVLAETVGLWFLNTQLNIPSERMDAANWVYQFSVLSFLLMVVTVPYLASIISHEKMNFYAYLGILEVILKLLIVFLLTWFDYDKLKFYAFLTFLVTFLVRLVYIIYCFNNFQESKTSFIWDNGLFKSMASFANWNLLGVFAGLGYMQGVNILLNIFFGPTINAARGIAFQIQGAVNRFVTSFQTAVNPPIIKAYATNNTSFLYNLVFTASKLSFFLLLILSIPIMINTKQILILWLKIIPEYSIDFTRLVLCDILIGTLSGSLQTLVQATGNVKKYQLLVSGILLLNLPISYIFLKLGFQPQITFVISILCTFFALIGRLVIIRSIVPDFQVTNYIKNVLFKVFLVFIISCFVAFFIANYIYSWNIIITTLIYIGITIIIIYVLGIGVAEKNYVNTFVKNKIKWKK